MNKLFSPLGKTVASSMKIVEEFWRYMVPGSTGEAKARAPYIGKEEIHFEKENEFFSSFLGTLWAHHSVKPKFVLVGIWNTIFGYFISYFLDDLFRDSSKNTLDYSQLIFSR